MGRPKLLLPFGDSTMLEQTIAKLLNSCADEVIVVVRDGDKEIIRMIANSPVKIAINALYQQGMSTSIVKGLSLVDDRAVAVMFALADQPFVDSKDIDKLIKAFLSHNKGIVIPVHKGKRGHPVVFSTRYREELLGLKDDMGGRQIIKQYPDDILEVAVDSQGVNIDIDTWQDYVKARSRFQAPD